MERLSAVGQPPSVRRAALRGEVHSRVNVPWDGGVHAFIVDARSPASIAPRIGKRLVSIAATEAAAAGC